MKSTKFKKSLPAILLALAYLASSSVHANILTNGSFESPAIGPATFINIYNGSSGLSDFHWTITHATVDIFSNGVLASTGSVYDGVQGLNLAGVGSTGGISQTFQTTAGTEYTLSFAYSKNPFRGTNAAATVSILDGATLLFSQSLSHNTSSTSNFDWILFNSTFTGTGNSLTLTFANTDSATGSGILLDAVSISAVPLPAAVWLFGSSLAGLGVRLRFRNHESVTT